MLKIAILLLVLSFRAYSPEHKELPIVEGESIQPYEAIWQVTCSTESSHNPYAIGDTALVRHSYGIVQIRESRLDEYNNLTGKHYTVNDLFKVSVSKEIFMYYACRYNPSQTESISRCWNGGPDAMNSKKKHFTNRYYSLILENL